MRSRPKIRFENQKKRRRPNCPEEKAPQAQLSRSKMESVGIHIIMYTYHIHIPHAYHNHVHIPYTYTTCIYHIHVPYTCTLHIPYAYTIYIYHVHAPCTCTMYMYHVHVPCTCTMYQVHVPSKKHQRSIQGLDLGFIWASSGLDLRLFYGCFKVVSNGFPNIFLTFFEDF